MNRAVPNATDPARVPAPSDTLAFHRALPGYQATPLVRAKELAVIEHPLPGREVPVHVWIARRRRERERERRERDKDRREAASVHPVALKMWNEHTNSPTTGKILIVSRTTGGPSHGGRSVPL